MSNMGSDAGKWNSVSDTIRDSLGFVKSVFFNYLWLFQAHVQRES